MRFPWQKKATHPKVRTFADYSRDSLEKLTYEHKVVSTTLAQLTSGKSRAILGDIRQDVRAQVHSNLLARKVEIELMIHTLQESVNTLS
jgi:hypothetical protein